MADIKNFGIKGIAADVQMGKKAKKIIEACNQSGAGHYVVEFGETDLPIC